MSDMEDDDMEGDDMEGDADVASVGPELRGSGEHTAVRIDKWLWAARFFKTRSIAATAIAGGKVELNGVRAKRSKHVRIGDRIQVRKGCYLFEVTVAALSDRRGSAQVAMRLYQESDDSIAAREKIAQARALERAMSLPPVKAPVRIPIRGRPTKKDRRALRRMKEGEPGIGR